MRVIWISILTLQAYGYILQIDNKFQRYSKERVLSNKQQIIGSISKFSPFYNIAPIGDHNKYKEKLLLFYIQEVLTNEVILFHYVEFDSQKLEIYHIINFLSQGFYYERKFKMINFAYEGIWHIFYLQFQAQNNIVNYGYLSSFDNQEISLNFDSMLGTEHLFVVGNSLQVQQNNQIINLRGFLGRLGLYFDDQIYENILQQQEFLYNILKQIDECQSNDNKSLKYIEIPSLQFKDINTYTEQMNRFYYVQFWFKVSQINNSPIQTNLNIITISIQNNFLGIEINSLSLIYQIINHNCKYNISYHNYDIPLFEDFESIMVNFDNNPIDFDFIVQWHLIKIIYQQNELHLKIHNYQTNKYISKVISNLFQYSSSEQIIKLGDTENKKFQSTVGNFQFTNCPNLSQQIDYCHYSCLTCFGPLKYNCITCPENSNRIYNKDKSTCSCQLFYLEEGKKSCQGIDSNVFLEDNIYLPTDPAYEQIEPEIKCSFGYFHYEGECYQCPSASQHNILSCIECIQNPNDWAYNDQTCQSGYVQYQFNQNAVFQSTRQLQGSFLMFNEELMLMNNFHLCTENSEICYLLGYDNKNKPVYFECDYCCTNYKNGICQSLTKPIGLHYVCDKGCLSCQFGQCRFCQTPKYFLNQLDYKCYLCTLQNCKYCFLYNIYDHEQVSAKIGITNVLSQNVEDYVLGCSLCYDNYIFDISINQCVQKTIQLPCLSGLINDLKNFICISYQDQFQGLLQEKQPCTELIPFCLKCLKDKYGMVSCIQCLDGFYLDIFTNICLNCEKQFQNAKTCVMQTNFKDVWKFEVQSFYINFLPSQTQLLVLYDLFSNTYTILQCIDGYQTFNGVQCLKNCEQNCLSCVLGDNNALSCSFCDFQYLDQEIFSFFNQKCQICPYPCKFCQENTQHQIDSVNSEFILNQDSVGQTYQCLLLLEEKEKTYLSMVNFNVQQRDQNGLRFKSKIIEKDFSEQLFKLGQTYLKFLIRKKIHTYVAKLNSTIEFQSNTLKKQIFTLQNMTLIYNGINDTNKNYLVQFLDFDCVLLSNLNFHLITNVYYITYQFGVSIQLHNLTYHQLELNAIQFNLQYVTNLTIQNLSITNALLKDQQFFKIINLFLAKIDLQVLVIRNLVFIECTFKNMSLLYFDLKEYSFNQIIIEQVRFSKCYFDSSNFYYFESLYLNFLPYFYIFDVDIQDTQFYKSNLFNVSSAIQSTIKNITLKNVLLQDSSIFLIQTSTSIEKIYIFNTVFSNSTFISHITSLKYQSKFFNINNLHLTNVSYSETSVFLIENSLSITLTNLNQAYINSNENQHWFFSLTASYIYIEGIKSQDLKEMSNIYIKSAQILKISNVKVYKIIKSQSQFQYLRITNFYQVSIENFDVYQLNVTNSQILTIEQTEQSEYQSQLTQLQITITNMNLQNNYILKSKTNIVVGILSISTYSSCLINILEVNYLNNIILHSVNDQLTNSPGLLLIDCQNSNLIIEKCIIQNNQIRNSSQSLWLLTVQNIQLDQVQVVNVNQIFDSEFSHDIQSIGGFSKITTQSLYVSNSYFQNIFAQFGSCFYIKTENDGILRFFNMTIQNSQSLANTVAVARGGSMYIDCSDSSLNFIIEKSAINNSISQNEGGFIYLIPSRSTNSFSLKDLLVQNLISPQNSFLSFDCSTSNDSNYIILQNVTIFVQPNAVRHSSILSKLIDQFDKNQQGFLILINCNVTIKNLVFQGVAYIPILYIEFSQIIIFKKILIMNTEQSGRYLIQILDLNTNQFKKLSVLIENLQIQLSKFIHFDQQLLQQNPKLIPKSLIWFNFRSSQTQVFVHIKQIDIIMNLCSECDSGLITIKSLNNKFKMQFQQMNFIMNNCGDYTCLQLNLPLANSIKLIQGKFIQNQGGYGGAINFQASKIQIFHLILLKNFAKYKGGAIQINQTLNSFLNLSQIYFIQNNAKLGGALMLVDFALSFEFYKQNCYFLDNVASNQNNAIAEQPSSLQLEMFGQLIETIRIIEEKQIYEKPYLQKYLNENLKIFIPSGQPINQYQRLQIKSLDYTPYQINLKIYAINSLGEKQVLQTTENCSISIYSKDSLIKEYEGFINFTNLNQIESFLDLSQLTVTIDPYELSKNKSLKIQCKFLRYINYSFTFDIEMFYCQMGEYYYQKQCLLCQAEKGYYSVKKKSYLCIKADPKMITSNKVNQVNLINGYWRPNYRSSNIEYCFKRASVCHGGWEVADSSCQMGNIGALCEECDIYNVYGHGQFYKSQNNDCLKCGGFVGKIFFTFVTTIMYLIIILRMVFSVSLTVNSVLTIFKSFKRLKMTSKYYDIIFRRNLDQSGALIKMIVNYFQILIGIHSFRLEMCFNFLDFLLPISNPFANSTFSYDCFISFQYKIEILYSPFIIGLLFPALCFTFYITLYLISVYLQKNKLSETVYFTALLYLFFYAQPNIIKEIGGLLATRTVSDINYISKNVSYLYYTQSHFKWIFIIIPFLICFAFIFPLFLLFILVKNRKYEHHERFRQIWGYIFNDYKKDIYYWEILKVSFREIIIFILVFIEENILLKGIIMFLLLLFYYNYAKLKQPFNIGTLNIFEQRNIFICALVIIFSCLKYQLQFSENKNFDLIIQLILFTLLITFLWLLFVKVIQTYYNKLTYQLDYVRQIILQKFPYTLKQYPIFKHILELQKDKQKRIETNISLLKKILRNQRKRQVQSLNVWNSINKAENSCFHTRIISNVFTLNQQQITLINQPIDDYIIQ